MNYKLYNGDCVEVMRSMGDNSVDLIITDPPYECENHGGGKTDLASRKLVKNKHIDFMSNGIDYGSVFEQMIRVCKVPNFLIFCSNKQVSKIMGYFENIGLTVTLLVWEKTNPVPLCNGKHLSDCEFIVYVRGKGATFNNDTPFEYKKKVYTSSIVSAKNRLHPAQKPVELLEQYIKLHSNTGDTVLDCFMGSCSTGVACVNTDRSFVGIELDKDCFDLAKSRLEEHKKENGNKLW